MPKRGFTLLSPEELKEQRVIARQWCQELAARGYQALMGQCYWEKRIYLTVLRTGLGCWDGWFEDEISYLHYDGFCSPQIYGVKGAGLTTPEKLIAYLEGLPRHRRQTDRWLEIGAEKLRGARVIEAWVDEKATSETEIFLNHNYDFSPYLCYLVPTLRSVQGVITGSVKVEQGYMGLELERSDAPGTENWWVEHSYYKRLRKVLPDAEIRAQCERLLRGMIKYSVPLGNGVWVRLRIGCG